MTRECIWSTGAPAWHNGLMTVAAMLRHAATSYRDKLCVVAPERSVTFAQFEYEVLGIAGWLQQSGIRRGDRIAILDVNSLNFIMLMCAAGVLGAILVPLNYRQRVPELRYQVRDSGAKLLFVGSRYLAEAEQLAPDLPLGWHELNASEFKKHAKEALRPRDGTVERESCAAFAICYTSGTTGTPKGAVITQQACYLRALKLLQELTLRHDDVMLMTTPMFHISCLMLSIGGLLRGATQIVFPQFNLDETTALIRREKITFINAVPTIVSMILNMPGFTPDIFRNLRVIMYTAAPMNLPLLRQLMSVYNGDLVQFLGQTEDLPQTVLSAADHRAALQSEDGARRLASVGRPCFGVGLRICDNDGRDLPPGEIGEIVTSGATNMTSYWNLPDATRDTLRHGWVFSGDLGYQDEAGYLFLAGRKKEMIIRGGENIYPSEVEKVLLQCPGIRDAVVVGMPDDVWGEVPVAVVVSDFNPPTAQQIFEFCRQHLASYRCPEKIFFRDQLPYNPAGKVEKTKVKEMILEMRDSATCM